MTRWCTTAYPQGWTSPGTAPPPKEQPVTDVPGDGHHLAMPGPRQLQWNVGTVLGGTTALPDAGETLTLHGAGVPRRCRVRRLPEPRETHPEAPCRTGSTTRQWNASSPQVRTTRSQSRRKHRQDRQPARATIGETVTFTVAVTIPRGVNFYNATVLDLLPAGFDAFHADPRRLPMPGGSVRHPVPGHRREHPVNSCRYRHTRRVDSR